MSGFNYTDFRWVSLKKNFGNFEVVVDTPNNNVFGYLFGPVPNQTMRIINSIWVTNTDANATVKLEVRGDNPGTDYPVFCCYLAPHETVAAVTNNNPFSIAAGEYFKIVGSTQSSSCNNLEVQYSFDELTEDA